MIQKEIRIFLIVGLLTVLIDFLSYHSLVWTHLVDINIAKALGFIMGTVFAYFANRLWTFGHKEPVRGSAFRFTLLYFFTLGANVLMNSLFLKICYFSPYAIQIAFLIATGTSATLNFIGMKWFAFKKVYR